MTTETLLEALRSPLTGELDGTQIDKLKAMAVEVEFEPNQIIFRENEECEHFYLILTGRVVLETTAPTGTVVVQTLGPGDEFGWSSLLSPGLRPWQARCLAWVRALSFDGRELLESCEQDHSFGFALMHRLAHILAGRLQAARLQLAHTGDPSLKSTV